ncbi:hypothetical protein [Sphingorhabdus pulchriflava]|nr:hypothetical protein [Sphingorhabdus pulchriflava]
MSSLFSLFLMLQSATVPLPEHIDIPNEHSTVICPTQAAAQIMLDQYYRVKPAPDNHTIDIEHFFAGLRATGCSQDAERKGVVTILSAKSRATVELAGGSERMLRYEGRDEAGKVLAGIVSEDGNNSFPRTDLAQWLSVRSSDGWLDARGEQPGSVFYRCSTPDKAKAVVSSLKGMEQAKENLFSKKLAASAAQQGCRQATDRYLVTGLLDSAGNECGFECYIDLTALSALDRSGMQVGLIFDGSLM